MKKEYFILIAVIIALSAYLVLKKDNQVNYDLPDLPAIAANRIDQIQITQADASFTVNKTNSDWTVSDHKYPADKGAVQDLLDVIQELKLTALVSESGDTIRYDLDKDNAIQVEAFEAGKPIRRFFIGKPAPSFNHTFVMTDQDERIFMAGTNFRSSFDKTIDEFRDKVVLSLRPDDIHSLTLEKDGTTHTFTRTNDAKADQADKDTEEMTTWVDQDKAPVDQDTMEDLLSSLSRLECRSFLTQEKADALKAQPPLCKISLENGEDLSLNLFEQENGEDLAGLSSSVPYAFDLASYQTEDILSYVDKLLGLELEPEKAASDQ